MSSLLPRAAWTTHPRPTLTPLSASEVSGICLHWPGTTGVIGDSGSKQIAGRLDGYRAFHVAPEPQGHGWADIAYQLAVDQAGRVWDLRGVAHRSAANGTVDLNRQWVAVLVMVGPGEQPTAAMVTALRWARGNVVLPRFPKATRVVGHGQIRPRPTACPGPALTTLIRSGALTRVTRSRPPAPGHPFTLRRYLRLGVTGRDVEELQRRLNRDRPDIRVDGDFGPVTRRTVEAWQSTHGLAADGVVGPRTAETLGWGFVVARPRR